MKAHKAKSTCNTRGKKGHRSGDPECEGSRETNITEEVASVPENEEASVAVRNLGVTGTDGSASLDSGRAVVDTACKHSVAVHRWYRDNRRLLVDYNIDH